MSDSRRTLRTLGLAAALLLAACVSAYVALSSEGAPPAVEDDVLRDMQRVPAGEFLMGSPPGVGEPAEQPQRSVYVSEFWIDTYEVTVADYRACVQAGACGPLTSHETDPACNWDHPERDRHPANCATWDQANAYCAWRGKRLPTEAEWEKAGRGTDGRAYPWGDDPVTCERAVWGDGDGVDGCGRGSTWPVGSKPAGVSPYGAHDMAGNVWEWVADWYAEDAYRSAPNRDPKGPASGTMRVLRGGGWDDYEDVPPTVRVAYHGGDDPDVWCVDIGFRCAR